MTLAVLGASALLALLLSEPGGEKVRAVLAESALTVVNLGEVVGRFARNGVAQRDIRLVLDPLPIALSCSTKSWPLPPECSCPRPDEQGYHSAIALVWHSRHDSGCGR